MLGTLKYFNIINFLKLIVLVLGLYYSTIVFNGIVSPEGNYYSSFLDNYLNIIDWFRGSMMFVANMIANAFGTNSYISSYQIIKLGKNIEFEIWLPCLGFGIISFWISFILTSTSRVRRKFKWGILGVFCIWFINCIRIALLIISVDRNWPQSKLIDHHDMFNIIAYLLIFIMAYYYTSGESKRKTLSTDPLTETLQNPIPYK